MMDSDSESGRGRPRGVRQPSLLHALYQLSTRRIVVFVAVLLLVPSFTSLYYFQVSLMQPAPLLLVASAYAAKDREYATSGSSGDGLKVKAGKNQPAQQPTEVATVEPSIQDEQEEDEPVTTKVIEVPKETPAVEKQPVQEEHDEDEDEYANVPEEDQDEDQEEEIPEKAEPVPEAEDKGNPPPVETKQTVPSAQAQPVSSTYTKHADKPTKAEASVVDTSIVQLDGPAHATQQDAPNKTGEAVVTVKQSGTPPTPPTPPTPHDSPKRIERRVIPLIAIDNPSPDLCKLMFSGMANGYPAPVLINWGNEGQRAYTGVDQSHLYKIPKALEYLDLMMGETAHPDDKIRDDDLILLIDGFDVWWQLPPEIFLSRFEEINRRADERLAKEWGSTENLPFKQTIVAGSQKRCTPGTEFGFNIYCEELPESPLRTDLYGNGTDKEDERQWRPRNFNAGTIFGLAGDMRRFLRRSTDRISRVSSKVPLVRSDQGMWAEVWSEQEVFRNWLIKQPNRADPAFLQDTAMKVMLEMFELGVGLDYFQELAIPTAFSEVDGAMVKFSNQSYIDEQSAKLGIDPVRLTSLPPDVLNMQTPMQRILPEETTAGWEDMTLYADFFTETVPTILHHNAYMGDLKQRREWWWDCTWYFPYLRRLGQKYMHPPATLPTLGFYDTGKEQIVYRALPSELTKRKPRRFSPEMVERGLPVMEFDDVCKEKPGDKPWFDEVFRDNLGPF